MLTVFSTVKRGCDTNGGAVGRCPDPAENCGHAFEHVRSYRYSGFGCDLLGGGEFEMEVESAQRVQSEAGFHALRSAFEPHHPLA